MIEFNLPGLYELKDLNFFFLSLYEKHREYFYDDIIISSIFGNFPYCIWDGGRVFTSYKQSTKEEIKDILDTYQSYQVKPRFIFTNTIITEKDLDDRFCNLVLKLAESYSGEIVVNSDLMKNYLQKNYPSYKLISSTTKCLSNEKKALEEIHNSDFYQICLDYNLNKNLDFLNKIPNDEKYKVELLVNAICPPNCPFRKLHYTENSKSNLSYFKYDYSMINKCQIRESLNHPSLLGKGNNLSIEDIQNYYKMGFKHFKLEGRTLHPATMLSNYLYYLIKPEYYFLVNEIAIKTDILKNSYNELMVYY